MDNQTDKKRNRLITLPVDAYDIQYTLPLANCRVCGYDGCLWLAMKIREDHSAVDKCPYMKSELYWLEPRSDCRDCGYDTCLDFTEAVNKDEASVFDCPYAYGKDKTSSTMPPKSGKTKSNMPQKSDNPSDSVSYKERLITLPVYAYDIEQTLPMTDCKVCGYDGCLRLAMKIRKDHSAVDKCPYMQSKLYWLEPRNDCNDCGYNTCLDFTEAVNKDEASVFDCPYAYGEDKTSSTMPPKSANSSDSVSYKERLITLPFDAYEIKHTLPMTDCKVCGYDGCLWLAMQIGRDHSAVDKCPYMQSKLYWLEPRNDCHDCGYDTCLDFTKAVNEDKASVFDCPYAYGEDKTRSTMPPKSGNSSDSVSYKERLITLPVDLYDIRHALPMRDCKDCGYYGCIWLARKIERDHSAVNKCPYMQSKLYWLEPRNDCHDCGYDTCFDFTKAVNEDKASVFDCPYAYGEDKPENKRADKGNTRQ